MVWVGAGGRLWERTEVWEAVFIVYILVRSREVRVVLVFILVIFAFVVCLFIYAGLLETSFFCLVGFKIGVLGVRG